MTQRNHLATITDALSRITSFSYDPLGRVIGVTFPSTLTESYTYDDVGNLTSKTDRKGQTISYGYDNLDRLMSKTYPDSTGVAYTYDGDSRLVEVTDPTGTYGFSYDHVGRLLGTTTNYSFLNRVLTTGYSYDAASNRLTFTDPEGATVNYTYDSLNRLTNLTDSLTGAFGFSYDFLGRRTQLTRPNGVNTNYQYDNLSRLLSVLHQLGGNTLDGAAYTVDAVGNRTSKADALAGVTSNFTYDAIYQLTQVVQGQNTTETYSFDAVGNRLSSLGVSPYSYNSSNELTSTPNAGFTYDNNGNTTSKTDTNGTTSYTWDFENRLTSVTLSGDGGTVNFAYDPFGRRIEKVAGSGTAVYAYDGDNAVEELDGSGIPVVHYSQGLGIDEPLAMNRSSVTSYYQADGLGSVTSLTDGSGQVAASYTYDSFGSLTNSTGSLTNPFRYTGREWDSETGLYYYRARYYDPAIGRFLGEDPEKFFQSSNFYTYGLNNPSRYVDPTGMQFADPGLALEIALSLRPKNLSPGIQFKYWRPFADGFAEALNRLTRTPCADFFERPCHEGEETTGTDRMRATEYRFGAFPKGPGVGAQDVDDTHVQINSMGLFMTATSGGIRLPDGSVFDLGSPVNVRAFILLHELGHQLKYITGFTEDADDAATNSAHSIAIINACFQ